MAKYSAIKAAVNAYIKANGKKEITGRILNSVLNATIDSLGKEFQFGGVLTPADDPGQPDQNVAYIGAAGTYSNFDNLVIESGNIGIFLWNGDWSFETIPVGKDYDNDIQSLTNGLQELSDNVIHLDGINEEDLSIPEGGKLQFANRVYNAQQPNGMGYVILRKNKTFAEQVTETNTIYEIRYGFTLSGNFIMPVNCVLYFNGGELSGAVTLNLRNTMFSGNVSISGVSLAGTLANDYVSPAWFGAKPDGVTDSTTAIQAAIDCSQYYVLNKKLCFEGGRYLISSPLVIRRRMEIDGMRAILTTSNNSLSCFLLFDTGASLASENITIKNLVFSSPEGCGAYGIKFYNAMVVSNHLENLFFSGFSNAVILLESTSGGGYSGQGVYAHGIKWNGFYTYGCSSLVRIIRSGNHQPYIYGGQINDIHFEGNHPGDDNDFIMDLSGFRNVEINNIIIEGVTSGTQKAGVVKLTESCSFKNFYVEFGSGSVVPAHTFYFNMRTNSLVNILGYYGALAAPFYLVNCDVLFETAAGTNLNGFSTFGRDNIIDPTSSSWEFTISNASLGTSASVSGNNRRFVPGINYAGQIWIDATTSMIVDDSEPIFRADLSQLTLGASGSSFYKDGLFVWFKTAGKQTLSFANDPIFGNIAIVESTADNNFLNAGIYFSKTKFNQYFGDLPDTGVTFVATIVPLVTPANGDVDNEGVVTPGQSNNKYYPSTTFCIGNKLKEKDIPHTLISASSTMTTGSYTLIRFDNPISGEVVSVPQKYAILEIAVFKGMRLGNCKARMFLD